MALNIPGQMEPTEDSFPRSARRVKKWLSELQANDIGELTRQFYHGLKHSNRIRNDARVRIEIMELLRPTARLILDNLLTRYATLSLPLPEKSRRIFDLHLATLQELAFGYKIALADEALGLVSLSSKQHALAAERAIEYLSEIMLRCSQLYQPLPKSIWSDLNQLYAGAERLDVHTKSLRGESRLTVEGAYKRALMFALCSPNRLRRGESVQLYRLLGQWTDLAQLGPASAHRSDSKALFGVALDANAPPARFGFVNAPTPSSVRTLDLNGLLPMLDEALQSAPESDTPLLDEQRLQRSTLLCLKNSWNLSTERKSARAVRNNQAIVEVGLKDIHAQLTYEREPAPTPTEDKTSFGDLQLMSLPQVEQRDLRDGGYITHPNFAGEKHDGDLWDSVAKRKPMNRVYAEEQRKRARANTGAGVKSVPRQQNWTVINVSAGGFGLRWNGNGPSRAHVGEVVSLREKTRDGRTLGWRVGVIRWMQFTEVNTFLCGVQLLSPRLVPVIAERRHGVRAQDVTKVECLILPEIKSIKQPSTLLVPSHTFKVGDITTIRVGKNDVRVKMIDALEQTSFFTQFQIRMATGSRTAPTPDKTGSTLPALADKRDPGDEFDGLWRSL